MSYVCFFILFIYHAYINISLNNISHGLSLIESPQHFESFFYILSLFELEILGFILHLGCELSEYSESISREEVLRPIYRSCMFGEMRILQKTWSRTESYIIIHTWDGFSGFICNSYFTFVIPTIGGICFFFGQILRSSG